MADTKLLSILHISDFHFTSRKKREQGIIVDALVDDLSMLCVGHRKPDLIIFTGDMVQAGGVDSHDDAYDFLLDRVSKATGCSDERIYIVPGNHDLSRAAVTEFADNHRYWRSALGGPNELAELNALYEKGEFDEPIKAKFRAFADLDGYLRGGDRRGTLKLRNGFATVDHIDPLNIDLVVINTAALSTGGQSGFDRDERLLAVPEYAIIEIIKVLKEGSLKIFATHHPFGMLSEQSARYLERAIEKHADVHLFGHMHDPHPKKTVGLAGEILADQAGALFTARRDAYNGYSLLTLDRSTGAAEMFVRSYYKDRSEFDEGIDVIAGGRWWSSQDAREYFRKIATPVDEREFRGHLAGPALLAFRERECAAGGEGDLHDRFVAPPLRRTCIQEGTADEPKLELETPVDFDQIATGDSNIILYAKPEYGRTTLLREIRFRTLADAAAVNFPRLPALIDFADISSNASQLLRKLRGGAELLPPENDLESLLNLGHALVLIDDVEFRDSRRMRILRDFVSRFPKARYIFSSPNGSATQFGAVVDPEMPVRFEFVEVLELRRNEMRQLLAKDQRCPDIEEWLDRLQSEFQEINLPFTAANGTLLIEILSEKYSFTPINRAVLMEQFVDLNLRKASVEQSKRETFDYTNKTDLLSYIAAWMARSDTYIVERESIRTQMKIYIDSRGLNVDIDKLLNEFLGARIFIARADGRLSFRYKGMLEYFIALRMTVDTEFRDWILEPDRYLRFINELLYYAGKLRNDATLVELIGDRHAEIMAAVVAEIGEVDLGDLETITVPTEKQDIRNLEEGVVGPPLTQEERDAELETQFPTDAEDRQEVFRPKAEEATDKLMLSIVVYSGMIKNMELISDGEKRRHLQTLWWSWSVLLFMSLRVIPRLAKERRVRINGALYEVQAPQGMNDAVLTKQMMFRLPHSLIKVLSLTLGTEKLERQLTEPTLDEGEEPIIYNFLRTGLIADLRLGGTPAAVKGLLSKLKDKHYLLWAFILHLNELRRLRGLNDSHAIQLEEPIAGAVANLKGGSRETRQSEKTRQLARFRRDRLMLTVKPDK